MVDVDDDELAAGGATKTILVTVRRFRHRDGP
jgi:hypothetical protein